MAAVSEVDAAAGIARFTPRRVCGDVERRAAVWAHDELRARGHAAWVETHWVRPWPAQAVALGCALAAAGGLLALAAPVAGLALAAVATLALAVEATGRGGPLRLVLPRRATQVVLVAPRDDRAVRVDLLLVARTDVPRRGLAERLAGVPGGLWWLVACALAVTAATGARVAGADGLALGAAQLVPTVALLLGAGGALDAALAPLGDGYAEDAALAAALALHDELTRTPAPRIAAGLLLAPPDALRAHLRRERPQRGRTALLYVRAGDVRSRHPQWRDAASAAGLDARARGPRGLPAALAPPEHAGALARALAGTL
jgi:hypothetical protein